MNLVRLGWPTPIETGAVSWHHILCMALIFIVLIGWVLALLGWRKTRTGESGLKLSVAGGVVMAPTAILLFPGLSAIVGGVFSARKPDNKSGTPALE